MRTLAHSLPLALQKGSGHLIKDDFGNDSDYCQYIATTLGITVLDCDYAKVRAL